MFVGERSMINFGPNRPTLIPQANGHTQPFLGIFVTDAIFLDESYLIKGLKFKRPV